MKEDSKFKKPDKINILSTKRSGNIGNNTTNTANVTEIIKNQPTQTSILSETKALNLNLSGNQITTDNNMVGIEMSCYLKEKVNLLEKENQMLKNELTLKMGINHLLIF